MAQLNSALDYGSRGCRFESCHRHKIITASWRNWIAHLITAQEVTGLNPVEVTKSNSNELLFLYNISMILQIFNTLLVIAVNFSLFKHVGQKENKKYLIYSLIRIVVFIGINLLFNDKEFNNRIFIFPFLSSSILIFHYFF